jgi:hypothetical protein
MNPEKILIVTTEQESLACEQLFVVRQIVQIDETCQYWLEGWASKSKADHQSTEFLLNFPKEYEKSKTNSFWPRKRL